jgi:hypothetical protein
MNATYPTREKFFAHKFVRLLHKAAVASEIGRDAFALLTVIVHTEDAMRYRGAAKFWNSQLVETLGFKKWDQFDACRKRAIEAGWLIYVCHGKRMAGEYWVNVPDGYEMVTDAPIESPPTSYPENGYDVGYKAGYDVGYKEGMKAGTIEGRSGVRTGDEQGEPSIPIPLPIPEPNPLTIVAKRDDPPFQLIASEYVAAFGGSVRITDKRRQAMRTRWRDEHWRNNWLAALELGCTSPFLRGENDRGWKIDIDFFLKPDTVTKIMEGKYAGQQQRKLTSNEIRERANAEAFASLVFEDDD